MAVEQRNRLSLISIVCATIALAVAVIAFATDHWVTVDNATFDKNSPPRRHELFPRHFGLIRECFKERNLKPADLEARNQLRTSNSGYLCHHVDHQIPRTENLALDSSGNSYIHILRSTFAMAVVAVASFLFAFIFLLFGIAKLTRSLFRVSMSFSLFGAVSLLILLILFHVRMRYEWHILERFDDPTNPSTPLRVFPKGLEPEWLKSKTSLRYYFSWSYAVTWVGVAAAVFNAIILRFVVKTHYSNDDEVLVGMEDNLGYLQSEADLYYPALGGGKPLPKKLPPGGGGDGGGGGGGGGLGAPQTRVEFNDVNYFDPRVSITRPLPGKF